MMIIMVNNMQLTFRFARELTNCYELVGCADTHRLFSHTEEKKTAH
jgi:hypothetical protein